MAKTKNHVKPTQAELAEEIEKDIEEAEKLKDVEEETPEDNEPTPNEAEPSSEQEDKETPEEPEEEVEPSPDYKEKFSQSSREAQKKTAANRVMNQALVEAEGIPEPTEDELKVEYSDWDLMSDIEKKLAKETIVSKNWRKVISDAKNQADKIEKWNSSVDEFADNPKTLNQYPDLEGKTNAFKAFASQDENNNVPFNVLVGAFLHENSSGKTPNKGRMFETGSGGPNERLEVKTGKITLDEARKLRETNYSKYKEYLMNDLIEDDL